MQTDERMRALQVLRSTGQIAVCAHVNPDGDAIGSVLGATLALRTTGWDVIPVLADDTPAPSTYDILPAYDELIPADQLEQTDVLLALDTTDISRLGLAEPLAQDARIVIVMDHHPDNTAFGDINVIEPKAAAVGAMLWEMLPDLGVEPGPDVATCLFTALMTDTGSFQYSNTDAKVLRTAAEMVDAGADPARISTAVYQRRSVEMLALTGLVLSRITLANDGQIAYSWFDASDIKDTGASLTEVEDLVEHIRSVRGPRVAFLVKSDQDGSRVSLRAKDSSDVGAVARDLGGGGHRAAAGFSIAGDLAHVLDMLLPLLPGGSG